MLYRTPDVGEVNEIVPVGTEHVGCAVTLPTGVEGAAGTAFTVTVPPLVIHVLETVLRTLKV
jgi:hypothetical protein